MALHQGCGPPKPIEIAIFGGSQACGLVLFTVAQTISGFGVEAPLEVSCAAQLCNSDTASRNKMCVLIKTTRLHMDLLHWQITGSRAREQAVATTKPCQGCLGKYTKTQAHLLGLSCHGCCSRDVQHWFPNQVVQTSLGTLQTSQ